ncbi:MAG: M10 family metallopeptidase, partial [Hyphomicrobium sp.]
MPKPWWSDSAIFAQLNSKKSWSGLSISYAFPTSSIGLSGSEKNGFSSFSAPQKNIATEIVQLWDDLINPRLVSVGADPRAQIKFANSSAIDFAQTYLPSAKSQPGCVWLNPFKNNGNAWTNNLANPTYGEWGYYIYIHEFGHALGLNHAGAYDRGSPTYENTANFFQDTQQYTVMSYFSAENSDGSWLASDGLVYSPQTPMLYDIMSIQRMYGADLKTRAGDTIYGYNANAGQNVYNFEINQHPVLCIYDAGGKDTLDNSNSPHACSLNLNPGSFSNTDMM